MRKVLRLSLVSHGMTEAMRKARFPVDEPLTEAGRRALFESSARVSPSAERVVAGPELRTLETARLLGLAPEVDLRLRDLDAGAWRGTALMSLPEEQLYSWLSDPGFSGHGGESVLEVIERTRAWLTRIAADGVPTVAVTHPAVVRAALLVTLDAPPKSFWRIDIPPGSVTELHHRGQWTLHFAG